jgi:probable aminopeptidase NPEPL1
VFTQDLSNALSSCAGLFILAHLGFDYPGVWMHVDMAAPVHCGERATGYGVALLVSLFGQYSNSELLQNIGPVLEESADDGNENERKKKRLN